jgi:hypothetical protein
MSCCILRGGLAGNLSDAIFLTSVVHLPKRRDGILAVAKTLSKLILQVGHVCLIKTVEGKHSKTILIFTAQKKFFQTPLEILSKLYDNSIGC